MAEETLERHIIDSWTKRYLEQTMDGAKIDDIRRIIKSCHLTHFDAIGMDRILDGFVGDIDAFIAFLEKEWNWRVDYDTASGTIVADENKDYCVCPLVKTGIVCSKNLCACSEGFAEKMFGRVLQMEVSAEVIRSYIRDGKSCVYRIKLPEDRRRA
jgi:hypothetical protein